MADRSGEQTGPNELLIIKERNKMNSLGRTTLALAKIDKLLEKFPLRLEPADPDYDNWKLLFDDRLTILAVINYLMRG